MASNSGAIGKAAPAEKANSAQPKSQTNARSAAGGTDGKTADAKAFAGKIEGRQGASANSTGRNAGQERGPASRSGQTASTIGSSAPAADSAPGGKQPPQGGVNSLRGAGMPPGASTIRELSGASQAGRTPAAASSQSARSQGAQEPAPPGGGVPPANANDAAFVRDISDRGYSPAEKADQVGSLFQPLINPDAAARTGSLLPSNDAVSARADSLKTATGNDPGLGRLVDDARGRLQSGTREEVPDLTVMGAPAVLSQDGFNGKARQMLDGNNPAYKRDEAGRDLSIGVGQALNLAIGASGVPTAAQADQGRVLTDKLGAEATRGMDPDQAKLVTSRIATGLEDWSHPGKYGSYQTRTFSTPDADLARDAFVTGKGSLDRRLETAQDMSSYTNADRATSASINNQDGSFASRLDDRSSARDTLHDHVAAEIGHGGDYRGFGNGGPSQEEALAAGRYIASRTDASPGGSAVRESIESVLQSDYGIDDPDIQINGIASNW